MEKLNRRRFGRRLAGTFGATAALRAAQTISSGFSTTVGLPMLVDGNIQISGSVALEDPRQSGIEHIVVVTMENRSFDHLLGWVPQADGRQSGLTYLDKSGAAHFTFPLAPDYTGCGHPDPNHSYGPDRIAYDNGRMDGFLRAGSNDTYTIGYYTAADIPFYAALASNYTVCDRNFAAILGPTFPNRMFLWTGQTDRLDDGIGLTSLPTIFDRLSAAGVSHRYYFGNVPYLSLWGLKYLFSASLFSSFLASAAAGALPAVSFVDPSFTVLDDGTGNDNHPHADIRNGDAFLSTIFRALTASPKWQNTVLIITFDEWGGFFEHVAPPRAVAPNNVDSDQVNGQVLLGFRVPVVIASPFTRNTGSSTKVSSVVFDHTSILKLIEWRWNLRPLTARDESNQIGNPAAIMNFHSPDSSIPTLPVATTVVAAPCFEGGIFSSSAVPATPRSAATGARATGSASPWGTLAATPSSRQWLAHPRFAADPARQ
jgi:phospholipase C